MGRHTLLVVVMVLCVLRPLLVQGSAGDSDFYYQQCTAQCQVGRCSAAAAFPDGSWMVSYPPFNVSIVSWSCDETCQYHCMTEITLKRIRHGFEPLKYYGHWPFERLFGLEEPASCLFSLLNLLPHALWLRYGLPSMPFKVSPLRRYLAFYAIAAVNAWAASTVYHAHKVPWTTIYDLSSALILLLAGLLLAVRKFLGKLNVKIVGTLGNGITFFALYRLYRMIVMQNVSFDEHMTTCTIIVAATTVVWILWICSPLYLLQKPLQRQHWLCLGVQVWFLAAIMLEVFDFPPVFYRSLDAHSLWHLATVPLAVYWYYFWQVDITMDRQLGSSVGSQGLAAAVDKQK